MLSKKFFFFSILGGGLCQPQAQRMGILPSLDDSPLAAPIAPPAPLAAVQEPAGSQDPLAAPSSKDVLPDMPSMNAARVTSEKKSLKDIPLNLDEDEELAKLLKPDPVHIKDTPKPGKAADELFKADAVKGAPDADLKLDSARVKGEDKSIKEASDDDGKLEAAQVKEAALDDKLGNELKSIVEQIQDMQREVAEALKEDV